MEFLLIGGSGFTGSFLIKEIKNRYSKSEIIVVDNQECCFDDIHYINCDLRKPERIYEVLKDVSPQYIFYLAGIFKSTRILLSLQINTLVFTHICEYYVNDLKNLKGILTIGSSAQYGSIDRNKPFPDENTQCNPNSLYGHTKLMQEKIGLEYHRLYDIPVFLTRTVNIIGPGQSEDFVIPRILKQVVSSTKKGKKAIIELLNINAGRDFIDVRDAARSYLELINRPDLSGIVFNVGSGKVVFLMEIIEILKNLLDLDEIVIKAEKSEIPDIHALNCGRIRQKLGWHPEIELPETIKDMINSL